jgi:DNA recombination protein RmuC
MLTVVILILVSLIAVVLAVMALLLFRPRRDPGTPLLQQQLIAIQGEMQRLNGDHRALQDLLPKQLADGRAEQAESLSRQVAALSEIVASQLADSRKAVGERLDETSKTVADVRERLGKLGEVTERLEGVGRTVTEVQQLLQVPKLRGTLGEVWLEEVLRQIFPESVFEMQYRFASGEIVDAIVRIGAQCVPIDSKFPLEACRRMLEADGDAAVRERAAFRRSLRARVTEIATKYIKPDQGTFDFAIMYVPAENVYYEAVVRGEHLEGEESFLSFAMSQRVIPVSPHTFYAYLSAVLYGLKGLRMDERGREMREQLGALEQSFRKFDGAFEKVGTHLGNAQKQYEEAAKQSARILDRFETISAGGAIPVEVAELPPPRPPAIAGR